MSCDCTPFVYVANSGVNNIPAETGSIPLGSVVREHTGCHGPSCDLDGSGIVCKGGRTAFHVHGHATIANVDTSFETPPVLSIELRQNGSTVQGSKVSENSSGRVTLPIDSVIRNEGCTSSVLTLVNTGIAVNLLNLALTVEPI